MPKEEAMSEAAPETQPEAEASSTSTVTVTADDVAKLNEALSKERNARKEAERKAREGQSAAARLAEIEAASASETEKAVAAARKEGEAAVLQSVNARLVKAEARAVAAELGFIDPADALGQIDLTEVTVSDEGDVDSDAVKTALSELAERKKYLLKSTVDTSAKDAGVGAAGTGVIDNSPGGLIRAGLAATSKTK